MYESVETFHLVASSEKENTPETNILGMIITINYIFPSQKEKI